MRNSKKTASQTHNVFETAPKAALMMLLSGLSVLTISALLTFKAVSPISYASPIALASLYIGAAIGGAFCAKMLPGASGFISAAAAALLTTALILIAKLFIPRADNSFSAAVSAALHPAIIIFAEAGALITDKLPEKRKRRKKPTRR